MAIANSLFQLTGGGKGVVVILWSINTAKLVKCVDLHWIYPLSSSRSVVTPSVDHLPL